MLPPTYIPLSKHFSEQKDTFNGGIHFPMMSEILTETNPLKNRLADMKWELDSGLGDDSPPPTPGSPGYFLYLNSLSSQENYATQSKCGKSRAQESIPDGKQCLSPTNEQHFFQDTDFLTGITSVLFKHYKDN